MKSLQSLLPPFSQRFLFIFLSTLMFLGTWMNLLLLGHPTGLSPSNCNTDVLLGVLVLAIIFTQQKHRNHFFNNSFVAEVQLHPLTEIFFEIVHVLMLYVRKALKYSFVYCCFASHPYLSVP
jgi:hypothetical protein